jgi:hypothetical protein
MTAGLKPAWQPFVLVLNESCQECCKVHGSKDPASIGTLACLRGIEESNLYRCCILPLGLDACMQLVEVSDDFAVIMRTGICIYSHAFASAQQI